MAVIKFPHLFTFDHFKPNSICGKPVGNNRTVTHWDQGDENIIAGALHGHQVFTLAQSKRGLSLTLDHCNWMTVTTRSAMTDFIQAAELRGSVSFAKGEFGVRLWDGTEWKDFDDVQSPFSIDLPLDAVGESRG